MTSKSTIVAPLPQHIEKYLGTIEFGWSLKNTSHDLQVVRISNSPITGAATYCTLGLSFLVMAMPDGRTVRQELVFSAYPRFTPEVLPSLLLSLGEHIIALRKPLLRGQVISPTTSLSLLGEGSALYCSIPVCFDPSFATFNGSVPPTVLVWLVPISKSEVLFIKTNGCSKFEDHLEIKSPDLWDLQRDSVV